METFRLPLKYIGYGITFQEVPEEISLVINISGCKHRCKGCHSKYLWEYSGKYISDDFEKIISDYKENITCVCFMGGEQNLEELLIYLKSIKLIGLKTCLYTGCDSIKDIEVLTKYLDWIKIGKYKEELISNSNIQYGVKLSTSNQKMLKFGIDF